MSMIEKMARAIWKCCEDEYTFDDAKAGNDGNGDAAYHFTIGQAKAALSAIKNPTDGMIDVGLDRGDWNQEINTREQREEASDVFAAMIEAAEDGK
ncbi:hypothetical protein [Rosistilla oblonga]|uniref:hypothetical protein n=1 Tax=Rosistilla oblonga TaxID=2527990 RepID=UPI003A974740